MAKFKDLTGAKIGFLEVLKRADDYVYSSGRKETMWLCRCKCGNEVLVHVGNLHKHGTVSCGCSKVKRLTKHGMADTRIDIIYRGMKQRCYDSGAANYCNYGGRGIKICDEWLNNKQSFFEWAEYNGYSDSLSIDRIDVNGDYSPENCRWVTQKVQSNNRRDNVMIEHNGMLKTVAEWSSEFGIPYQTIYSRLRAGWSVADALCRKTTNIPNN